MPIVAHNQLPAFNRLQQEGIKILQPGVALHQDIRELHIGLLNMMPDAAISATERQFFRLIGESNPIAQFFVHPFTLDSLPRSEKAKQHIDTYYETFEEIRAQGLDGLIVTGANVEGNELSNQDFWEPLIEVFNWAHENVCSTLCSCLATHAVMEFRYKQQRFPNKNKIWGVYPHKILESHPLVRGVNTRFDVPHSRWNSISEDQFKSANLRILAKSNADEIHLATSEDGLRTVFFQGHPEYDNISLLKEYKREVMLFIQGKREDYPPFPDNYFNQFEQAIFREYRYLTEKALEANEQAPDFPEHIIIRRLNNTWHDTADEIVSNWMGLIYQVTHKDRNKMFMDHIDPENPLGLKN
ncbi:MAG: homoserine O-succinyltransferase [Gammaproteobacteria bacterium]|nr:homoserine O-succinyltransferase [Gammaproteobacteria bacterium]